MRKKATVAQTRRSEGTSQDAVAVRHEEIARYAYRLYEERGRVAGHDLEDWLAAERALSPDRRLPQPSLVSTASNPASKGRA